VDRCLFISDFLMMLIEAPVVRLACLNGARLEQCVEG
jgi:hypothetical protein